MAGIGDFFKCPQRFEAEQEEMKFGATLVLTTQELAALDPSAYARTAKFCNGKLVRLRKQGMPSIALTYRDARNRAMAMAREIVDARKTLKEGI